MTGLARVVAVAALMSAVLGATAVTAEATFSEKVSAAPVEVTTLALAPVEGLEVKDVVCDLSTYSALVEWRRSSARGVTGYRVTAHMQNGQTEVISETGADVLEVAFTRNLAWLQRRPTVTVTVLTSYGWTSQTARTAILTC